MNETNVTYSSDSNSPQRSPIFNVPPIIGWCLGVIIGIHVLRLFLPDQLHGLLVFYLAFIPARFTIAYESGFMEIIASALPLATHSLLHADFNHLLINSLWFLAFGGLVARRLATPSFLLFLALTAIAGGLAHYISTPMSTIPLVGASGAISGLMGIGARIMFPPAPMERLTTYSRVPTYLSLLDSRVISFTVIWVLINLLFGLSNGFGMTGEGSLLAWQAHLGGYFAGLLLTPLFLRR